MLAWFLWENMKIKAHLEDMGEDGGDACLQNITVCEMG